MPSTSRSSTMRRSGRGARNGGTDLVPGRALARQRPGRGLGRGQLGEFLVECEHALVDGKRGHGFVPGSKSVICTCDPAPMHVSRLLLPTFWPFSKPATATGESKPDPEGVATTDDRIERLVMALPDPVLVVAARRQGRRRQCPCARRSRCRSPWPSSLGHDPRARRAGGGACRHRRGRGASRGL